MRPSVTNKTGTGTTPWIPLDITQNPFSASVGITLSATGTYSLEYTYDDVFDATVTPVAFTESSISAATTNKDVRYTAPVRAVRLNVAANTGTVKMTVLQGLGL